MSYNQTIKGEAHYADSLGPNATEDKFHATYNGILTHWFPSSQGYIIDHQVMGEGGGNSEYIVVRHAGTNRNPLLIVELKRSSKWTAAGKNEIEEDLTFYMEGRFDITQYNTIYGLGGIGLHWAVYKMEKSGNHQLRVVENWKADIASDTSYTKFQNIASLVYNIT
jgi:hypothetical protein